MSSTRRTIRLTIVGAVGIAIAAAPLAALPASASTDGTGIVISEVYLNGGSAGATFENKYVELYNPTSASIDVSGDSLQYRSATGTANPTSTVPLTGSIPAHGHYLVEGASNGANGVALPTPDVIGASLNVSGTSGTIFLAAQTTALTAPPTGSIVGNPAILDLYGYGTSNTFEGAAGGAASTTTSRSRDAGGDDTDSNASDFTAGAPSPTNAAGDTWTPTSPGDGGTATIEQIQGTTDTSPYAGQSVTTDGVVTAAYPTGGFAGYYLQSAGTGGALDLATHTASDAVFVYSPSTVGQVTVGEHVKVTGTVSEYQGMTELSTNAVTPLADGATVQPATVTITPDTGQRESLEGMLVAPQGDFTITDDYDTNYYGSIVLNPGTKPLDTPTQVVEPGPDAIAKAADNAARVVTLDDGSSTNFNTTKTAPLPYLSTTTPVRVGESVTFTKPVILDYRFGSWNLQPTQQLTPSNAAAVQPVTFSNTRTAAPASLGGDLTIASFNVLNYFTTTGDELAGCEYYDDKDGEPITVSGGCDARGAATQASLDRQQAKIVAAITRLGAGVVSLEEIENSIEFGEDRDASLAELVTALNAAAGAGTWAYVPSPAVLPDHQDVIRTAFIYKPALVQPVGGSTILDDPAFDNARQPLAQEFELAGHGSESAFLAIVNHFKSKGSGDGVDADQGDGQGASNASRVAQAHALVAFADNEKAATGASRVVLMGDFNAYLQEDPIDVIRAADYTDLGSTTGKSTYAFDGAVGSLDHIFVNDAAKTDVTGADVWNINAYESVALEYSRYDYNAVNLYAPDQYRASDHDPILVGLDLTPLLQLHTTPVAVIGIPIVGLPLLALHTAWGPAPVHETYQWSRDGVDIPGATRAYYVPTRADRGHRVTVTVTGSKAGYATATRTGTSPRIL